MDQLDTGGGANVRDFGRLADGRAVEAIRLAWPGGVEVEVLTWGATLRSFRSPADTGSIETLLQLPALADYEADTRYLNCVIGRCANRIKGASFVIGEERFHVEANEGRNALHGGRAGWNKRLWRTMESDDRRCVLAYTSPDGEGGFPGAVEAQVIFTLVDPNTLEIEWTGRASRPTPLNLTHHLYFNLSGPESQTIASSTLQIEADIITPVAAGLIPTGELRPVAGTVFDLREPRRLGDLIRSQDPQIVLGKGLDLSWCLSRAKAAVKHVCLQSSLSLTIDTDQLAVQVYSGQALSAPFIPHGALVLEPQGFPDAVNNEAFPKVLVGAQEFYSRTARYHLAGGGVHGAA